MKKVLYVIIALLVIYLIMALIGPKHVLVERNITIHAPASLLREKLPDLKFFHDSWNPWTDLDSNMKVNYTGNPGEAGQKYEWAGNKEVGDGVIELISVNNDSIVQKLNYQKNPGQCVKIYIKEMGDTTNVRWQLSFDVGFFGRPVMLVMSMDKFIGPMYEKGLVKLKKVIEEMKTSDPDIAIEELQWEEKTFCGTEKSTVTFDKLMPFFTENMPKVFSDLQKAKIESCMAPCGLFYDWNEDKKETTLAVAACVSDTKNKNIKNMTLHTFPASKVLFVKYSGGYSGLVNAHNALGKHMKKNGINTICKIEEYITDPMTEKDSTKWVTNIFYLVK